MKSGNENRIEIELKQREESVMALLTGLASLFEFGSLINEVPFF